MTITIIHPTARVTPDFAQPWWLAAKSALKGCDLPQAVEYLLVVHHSRIATFWEHFNFRPQFGKFTVVVNYGRDCLIDQCNEGQRIAQGDIIVGNQDDMRFPEHWDTEVVKLLPDPNELACVHADVTGNQRELLCVQTIATRALVDLIGPASPEYDGMFSDDEWTLQARRYGKVRRSPLHFEHIHPALREMETDSVHAQENRKEAYAIGREVFRRRMLAGFPRVDLPGFRKPAPEALPLTPTRTIALCCPGESHRAEWEMAFMRVFSGLAQGGWIARFYPGYTTNVYNTRMGVTRDVFTDSSREGNPDFLLWIDDDNPPTIEAVRMLIETLDTHPELSGAAGWCWIKTIDPDSQKIVWMPSCGNFKPGTEMVLLPTTLESLFDDNAAPKAIEWTGFPLFLVRFDAVQKLGLRAFRAFLTEETEFGMSGEDIAFCLNARAQGLKFAVVPNAKVEHLKFGAIEPTYAVSPNASPAEKERLQAKIDAAAEPTKGKRLPITQRIREFMGAHM